ncbi:MAG TPA: Lon family ATP-dependent protease [Candidatus Deferrimicrobium sp.]|nr:Lon family ATP-dependent protease [Candidatus Deferrimicrobium sp.]
MKNLIDKLVRGSKSSLTDKMNGDEQLKREVDALYNLMSNLYGADKLILKATKLEALQHMRSESLLERVLGLQKLVFEDPTLTQLPQLEELSQIVDTIQDQLADQIARRSIEDNLEKRISEKMQEKHEDYVKEIKMQVLKESAGPENAQTLKRLAVLEKLETVKLAKPAMEVLRPEKLEEVVGQERAINSLLAKMAAPFPQHILIYGPPGVGKTTAARIALEKIKEIGIGSFGKDAPFVEVDGTTLRWDPRDVTNPLLGSVHDPIYQGARRDLADSGIPEPKLGLVTDSHGGVLFIDEIGEMEPMLLNKLLKVLEDKRAFFESSYYDPHDPNVPQYIKKVFNEGAPADFVLIGATTREPSDINPALRSRCAEIFFEPLTPGDIMKIINKAAEKLHVTLEPGVAEIISEYTIEGRKANNILADAYGLALYKNADSRDIVISQEDVYEVLRVARLSPYVTQKATKTLEIGKTYGLGVAGFLGSVLEIEAEIFSDRKGKGTLRFNDTAGSMAKDSVFNAAAVLRRLTGKELQDYDLHINIIGGGRIDGPSAGLAITLAVYSALQNLPLRQDVAITGEISIRGKVRPVGGVFEKIYGAKQAGISTVIIPEENAKDVPTGLTGIQVIPVKTVEEAMQIVFPQGSQSLVV